MSTGRSIARLVVVAVCCAFIVAIVIMLITGRLVWVAAAGQSGATIFSERVKPDRSRFPYSYNSLQMMSTFAMREPRQGFARWEAGEVTKAARPLVTLPPGTRVEGVPPATLAALTLGKMRQRNFAYAQQHPFAPGDGREFSANDELLASTERVYQWENQHVDMSVFFPETFRQARTQFMISSMPRSMIYAVETEMRLRLVEFDVCKKAAMNVKGYDITGCFAARN